MPAAPRPVRRGAVRHAVAHLVNGIPHAEVGQAVVLDDIEQHRAVDAILDERTLVALQPKATEGLSGVRHVTVM